MFLPKNASVGFTERYRFWILLVSALIIHQLPIVSIPFKWLESYFHEISHGLAALLSGGKIIQIQLFPNGAGLCTTQGGWRFLISFMGYTGATLWGVMIFSLARVGHKVTLLLSSLLIILLVSSLVFWVRDLLTLVIVAILLVLFVLPFKFNRLGLLSMILQLTGVLVLLNSLYSPFYLFDGRSLGDGAALADITAIPEVFWVLVWLSIALYAMYLLGIKGIKARPHE